MRLKPPKFIRWLMPDLIWEMKDRSAVYLTFDDGPTPGITEWILSTLDKYDAKATFFVLGKNAEMYPDLYRRILDAGHRIGNHTYSHQKGWGMSLERYIEDVDFANDLLPRRRVDRRLPRFRKVVPQHELRPAAHASSRPRHGTQMQGDRPVSCTRRQAAGGRREALVRKSPPCEAPALP